MFCSWSAAEFWLASWVRAVFFLAAAGVCQTQLSCCVFWILDLGLVRFSIGGVMGVGYGRAMSFVYCVVLRGCASVLSHFRAISNVWSRAS